MQVAGMEQNCLQSNRQRQLGTAHPCQTQPGQAQLKKFRILQKTGDLEQYTEQNRGCLDASCFFMFILIFDFGKLILNFGFSFLSVGGSLFNNGDSFWIFGCSFYSFGSLRQPQALENWMNYIQAIYAQIQQSNCWCQTALVFYRLESVYAGRPHAGKELAFNTFRWKSTWWLLIQLGFVNACVYTQANRWPRESWPVGQ